MSLDKENILVLSYNENQICVDGARESYKFKPSNGLEPVINIMPLSDILYINSNTQIIKTGWLTFEDKDKAEIFKELRIHDWENILTNDDIKQILIKPTMEGLQRIIDIDNISYFDRIRIILHALIQDGVDITTKVKNVIDTRYNELKIRQRVSSITLTPRNTAVHLDKITELEEQNKLLKEKLDQFEKTMQQFIQSQQIPSANCLKVQDQNNDKNDFIKTIQNEETIINNNSNTNISDTKKSPGRPKKNKDGVDN